MLTLPVLDRRLGREGENARVRRRDHQEVVDTLNFSSPNRVL